MPVTSSSERTRTLVIANPHAAGGEVGARWSVLRAILTDELGSFTSMLTQAPGDARREAAVAQSAGFRRVIALGGDGTASEVVDGLLSGKGKCCADRPAFALLNCGTGGDFARSLRLPKSIRKTARDLREDPSKRLDVGRLTYKVDGRAQVRHFINIASFGIGALVDDLVARKPFGLGRQLAPGGIVYGLATLQAVRRYIPPRVELTFDDGPVCVAPVQCVAVANGRYFGGGMQIAPEAKLDDGLLDVVTIAPMKFLQVVRNGHHLYRGTHLHLPQVRNERTRRLIARPARPSDLISLDIDGDAVGTLPAIFDILPAALRYELPAPSWARAAAQ